MSPLSTFFSIRHFLVKSLHENNFRGVILLLDIFNNRFQSDTRKI